MAIICYFLGLEYYLLTRSFEFLLGCRLLFDCKGEIDGRGKDLPASTLVPVKRTTSALHCQLCLPNMLKMEYFDVYILPTQVHELVEIGLVKMSCFFPSL